MAPESQNSSTSGTQKELDRSLSADLLKDPLECLFSEHRRWTRDSVGDTGPR